MIRFPNLMVFVLSIFISFLLFGYTVKLNWEKTALEHIAQTCQLYGYTKTNCSYYMSSRIKNDYNTTEEELLTGKNQKLVYLSLIPICIILSLFIVFAANQNEILLSFASIIPLVFYLTGSDEAWLIPIFLIILPASAFLFLHLKNYLSFRLPQSL